MALGDVVGVRAEDLAGRDLDQALDRAARRKRGLEHVVGADHVHPHRPHRAFADGVDACDCGEMDYVGRAGGDLADRFGVENVGLDEGQVRVLCKLAAGHGVSVQVVQGDDLVVLDQATGERRADKARSAGQKDAFARQRHGGECIGGAREGTARDPGSRDQSAPAESLLNCR